MIFYRLSGKNGNPRHQNFSTRQILAEHLLCVEYHVGVVELVKPGGFTLKKEIEIEIDQIEKSDNI